jgi:hypothetical protein
MELCHEYPFQWSNTDNRIKHHCFVLPIDRKTSRCFFLFYYDPKRSRFRSARDDSAEAACAAGGGQHPLVRPLS